MIYSPYLYLSIKTANCNTLVLIAGSILYLVYERIDKV